MSEREKFESWAKNKSYDLSKNSRGYIYRSTACAFEGWQAAISTRKAYGYGIVDKDGEGRVGFGTFSTKEAAESECYYMNEPVKNVPPLNGSPFRVVELFYEDSES